MHVVYKEVPSYLGVVVNETLVFEMLAIRRTV